MPNKGSSLSTEAIQAMKESKLKTMLKKFDWSLAEEYLDNEIKCSAGPRRLKHITFREFRKNLLSGYSMKDMKRDGVSKHLLQFFSNFLQGKVKLEKQVFINEYTKGLSMYDIAKKYHITKNDIRFLRQLYNQKKKGATYLKRIMNDVPLSKEQKAIIYGCLLGDSCRGSSNAIIIFKHGEPQKDYLLWKFEKLRNLASDYSLQSNTNFDPRYGTFNTSWRFYTHSNSEIEIINNQFYEAGKRDVTQDIIDNLTDMSIAVWFMDDGTTEFTEHKKYFSFCTDSFSKEGCLLLVKHLKDKYDIKSYLRKRTTSSGKIVDRIVIDSSNADKFLKVIKPYILPVFFYKIEKSSNLNKKISNKAVSKKILKDCPFGEDFLIFDKSQQDSYISHIVEALQPEGLDKFLEKASKNLADMHRVFKFDSFKLIHDDHFSICSTGNQFLMSHFPGFLEAKSKASRSPREIFENKEYLSEIVRKILINERCIDGKTIIRYLKGYRGNRSVSGFMPCLAKSIYEKYCSDDAKVLDFCAGYGGRLFGAMANEKVASYTGIEVNFKTYLGLMDLYKSLRVYKNIDKIANVLNGDSIDVMQGMRDKSYDFCFTSTPYFNTEEYEQAPTQSFKKYPSYSRWFEEYLIRCVKEAIRVSKKVGINIANTGGYYIADDLEAWLKDNNFDYEKYGIKYSKFGGGSKIEPIFIFEEKKQ